MTRLRDLVRHEPKRGLQFPRWLESLVSVGIVARDPDVVRRQCCVNVAVYATVLDTISHFIFNSLHDFRGLLPVNVYNVVMATAPLLIPRLHRYGENVGAVALGLLILFGHTFVVWSFGLASDLQIYYTLVGAALLLVFGVQHWRLYLVFFALYLGALLLALNVAPIDGLVIPQDEAFRDALSTQAMVSTLILNAAILFYALTMLRRAELAVEDQYERSEALIATVMPPAIAERLKSGREQRIADRIEMLSVLFADLAGFSTAAHELPPEQVVAFLDQLVSTIDALAEAHGVDKIKTIGDSYMAAAGFKGNGPAGAVAIGRFALAMLAVVERQPPLGIHKLKARIGIHCGPATAGVIGDSRISYDVWGDAVNVASRMESQGLPDCIQVSETFRDLARDAFVFQERGATELKGVGVARTFFLIDELKPPIQYPESSLRRAED
jgi:adenylate cyclase